MTTFTENEYLEHRKKVEAERLALEQELISAGGEGVLLTQERSAVLALRPIDLLQRLRDGTLSAVTVLQAYQAKSIELSRRTNCITEFIPDTLKWAEALDSITPELRKPLHGLPVSVKDSIAVRGMDTTLGLLKQVNKPAEDDADVVTVVKQLGAIPFVKTSVPQLSLTVGCSNPLWGETVHPLDPKRSPGGSTGGEGALIAEGGSVFGLGTDLAGSVRMPATWCGIVGVKPTSKRVSSCGAIIGQAPVGVFGTVGMMFPDAAICNEVTRAIFTAVFHEHNADVPPLPWNDAVYLSKTSLRIGVLDFSKLIPVTLGVQRALNEASSAFEKLGHEIVPYSVPRWVEGLDILSQLFSVGVRECITPLLEGEILDDGVIIWFREAEPESPPDVPSALSNSRSIFGNLTADQNLDTLETASDLWKKTIERSAFCDSFLKNWKAAGLDLLMSPVSPCPAPLTQYISRMIPTLIFAGMFNLLDYPCVAVPVTRQTEEDDENIVHLKATNCTQEMIKEIGTNAVGLPLGVQLAALPYQEELLCRASKELSQAVNFKLQP